MSKIKELRDLSGDELEAKLLSLLKEMFKLRMNKASLEKVHPIRKIRRTIARIKTIMTERVGKSHVKE